MAITLDNASNNKALVESLQRRLPNSFKGEASRGNCLTHVQNLAAKDITAPFERRAAADALDDDDNYELPDYDVDDDEAQDELDNADDDDFTQFLAAIDEDEDDDEGGRDDEDEDSLKEQAAAVARVLAKVSVRQFCICRFDKDRSRSANYR